MGSDQTSAGTFWHSHNHIDAGVIDELAAIVDANGRVVTVSERRSSAEALGISDKLAKGSSSSLLISSRGRFGRRC